MKKTFKIFNYSILFFFALVLFPSCEEEERGPLTTDNTIPSPVSNVSVENSPGGAFISYDVPNDNDLLYVEVNYHRNGENVTDRASVYKNTVNVEGLIDTAPQEVTLVSVDKSNNKSEPVSVTITPETAPIFLLYETVELIEDFGGVRLKYDNYVNLKAEILFYLKDESGNWVYQNKSEFIENDSSNFRTFRTYPPESRTFGVSIIDRWNNTTDIKEAILTPIEEVILDRENFEEVTLNKDAPSAFQWFLPYMWNGTVDGAGFHTAQDLIPEIVPPYTQPYHMFTMDLGVTRKLSRFKFWQRQGSWIWVHGNPRYFEVWGTDELPADNGDSLDGWTKLVENGETVKPSGGPPNSNSAEDQAVAADGHEFIFPVEAPPVRYIRFVNQESWSGGLFMHIMELSFWGSPE